MSFARAMRLLRGETPITEPLNRYSEKVTHYTEDKGQLHTEQQQLIHKEQDEKYKEQDEKHNDAIEAFTNLQTEIAAIKDLPSDDLLSDSKEIFQAYLANANTYNQTITNYLKTKPVDAALQNKQAALKKDYQAFMKTSDLTHYNKLDTHFNNLNTQNNQVRRNNR